MTDIMIHTDVSPKMHPNALRGDSPGVLAARVALGNMYVAESKIRDLHAVVHNRALLHQRQFAAALPKPADGKKKLLPPLMYDEAAANHVIETGTPLAKAALASADSTIATLTDQIGHLDSTIALKLNAGKSSRDAELRAWAAKQENTFMLLGEMAQKATENKAMISAVLDGESYLSGITPENQALIRTVAGTQIAPEETQAREQTAEALSHLTDAAKSFVATTSGLFTDLQSVEVAAMNQIVKGAE